METGLLEAIVDRVSSGILIVTRAGKVTVYNRTAADILCIPVADVIGRQYADVLPVELSRLLRRGLESGVTFHRHSFTLRCTGHLVGISTSVLDGDRGATIAVAAIFMDVTAFESVKEKVTKSERLVAMGALAAGLAHNLRNPLNAIRIVARRLRQKHGPADADARVEYDGFLDSIDAQIARADDVLHTFLNHSFVNAELRESLDARTILGDCVGRVGAIVGERRVALETVLGTHPVLVQVQPAAMHRAFLNVLTNAVEASPEGGTVTVSLSVEDAAEGRRAVIEIGDQGQGIPPEHLGKVMEFFFTTKPEGVGLGLPETHNVVRAHGGAVDILRNQPRGTLVRILLPCSNADQAL